MTRRYIAQCRDIENHDPIESGSPRGVWNQLQKATGRDRKWLQDFGWRVKLKPEPTPTPEPLELTEPLTPWLEPADLEPIESPYYQGSGLKRGLTWGIPAALVLWVLIYCIWTL